MTVSIYTSALASDAQESVFLPWLRRVRGPATTSPNSVAILVPQRADASYLKSLALASGLGLWGVHFLTPGDLRDRLRSHLGLTTRIPIREHLHLLLATAAEHVGRTQNERVIHALAAAPDQLLKAVDMIGGAGWEFRDAGPSWLWPVVREFYRLLDRADWQMMHQANRDALAAVSRKPACFTELFVFGFNPLHWPQWPLLEAAVRLAKSTVVCLSDPRPGTEELDGAWIGTWENTFAASQPVASDSQLDLFAETFPAASRQSLDAPPDRPVEFLVADDTADHARAIVARALQFLADKRCERLGILFPAAGALPRRAASLLAELDIPHYDGLGHRSPGPLEDVAWPAWLALQENPGCPALLRFLDTRPKALLELFTADDVTRELERASQELLIDDLRVIADYLAEDPREHLRNLGQALREWPLLPENATLREYFGLTDEIFVGYGWTDRRQALEDYRRDWEHGLELSISRRTWLRWLRETLVSWQARRSELGNHPYSRLHLLPYSHAESQAWTHLIAAGLNEGHWPPAVEESGFLHEEEIKALNGRVRTLNQRAAVQGRQGEGHVAVEPGKTICLGPAERRLLVERQFFNTLESAAIAVTATIQLRDEATPERPLNPSEFFTALYFGARRRPISQDALNMLRNETARWLARTRLWPTPPTNAAIAAATRNAFDARRDPGQPFGPYEFALCGVPPRPFRLTATDWENALAAPAPVFLQVALGVTSGKRDEETPWTRTQGIWVHRWLSAIAPPSDPPALSPLPRPPELRSRLHDAAERFRRRILAALAKHGRTVPDWWESTWQQAKSAAHQLLGSVADLPHQAGAFGATEWRMKDVGLPLPDGPLFVRGRIDLLLSRDGSLRDVWLVDYKTGPRKELQQSDIAAGRGIQFGLYAMALRAAGAGEIGVSLLAPGITLTKPQLYLSDFELFPDIWRILLRMQETGVFGMRGPIRDEFGHPQEYPLATLAIDEDILAAKWAQAHPVAAVEEDEA
jgi:hypothetical protein